jgi:23S rRNA pseudouridine1911/1915/1917 synthase
MTPSRLRLDATIPDELAGRRLDQALAELFPDHSRSRLTAWVKAGDVLVDGEPAVPRQIVHGGEQVALDTPVQREVGAEPEDIALDIRHEDADIIVVDKPAGLVVHPGAGNAAGTLQNALLHHDPGLAGIPRGGIVHRLDKDTSGLLMVAKTDAAHRTLADELRHRRIRRRYLVAAWGHLPEAEMTVDAPIARNPGDRLRMAVVEGGRRAVTHFRRRERWPAAELLEAQLETGRTHQIRVHLLHLGHPVVGDAVYGAGRERGFANDTRGWARELARRTPRQFLHAAELRFTHPRTGEEMRFEAPLPAELQAVLDWARQGS